MARYLIAAIFLAVCLLNYYIVQATPVQDKDEQQPNPVNDIEAALKSAMESIQKGLNTAMKDPHINELYQNGTQLLQNAMEAVRKEADKLVPKTE